MATYYSGIINLSKIPKDLIKKNRNGDSVIYVDFAERKTPSPYGTTHYLKIYDVTNRQSVFIGDFSIREVGSKGDQVKDSAPAPAPMPAGSQDSLDLQPGDLPF